MILPFNTAFYENIIKYYGKVEQIELAKVKLDELNENLEDYYKYPHWFTDLDRYKLVGQIAEACIMLEQVAMIFDVSDKELLDFQLKKNSEIINKYLKDRENEIEQRREIKKTST